MSKIRLFVFFCSMRVLIQPPTRSLEAPYVPIAGAATPTAEGARYSSNSLFSTILTSPSSRTKATSNVTVSPQKSRRLTCRDQELCTKSHLLVSEHRRFAFADRQCSCVAVPDFLCKADQGAGIKASRPGPERPTK